MRPFLLALRFLTIFPLRHADDGGVEEIGRSISFFPLVGALQGIILAGLAYLLTSLLPWELISAIILVLLILTNGGIHLDGLADTFDGLAGGRTRKERLRIMRDPQIGAIGVVAIVLILLIKFLLLKNIPHTIRYSTLFLLPVFGRWSIVPMAYWGDYARKAEGLGATFTEHTGRAHLIAATTIAVVLSVIPIGIEALAYLLLLFISAYLWTLFFRKRLGGVTGDVFGFQSEISEVIFLLLIIIKHNGAILL
ncbi:MAG: adenosylcobinamide-GDP ribazoletransferase [Thermodesulfobacteriota bacterium]